MLIGAAALAAGALGLGVGLGRERIVDLLRPAPPPVTTVFHRLPDITVNLRPGSDPGLLKIGITLRLTAADAANAADAAGLAAVEPVILDGLTAYLRQVDAADLDGAAGLEDLRARLLHRVRLLAEPVRVDEVLLRTLILN
jgi:flagellar FliL protein